MKLQNNLLGHYNGSIDIKKNANMVKKITLVFFPKRVILVI